MPLTFADLKELVVRLCEFSCLKCPEEVVQDSNIDVDCPKSPNIPLPIPPPYPKIVDDYVPEGERDSVSEEAADFYQVTENDTTSSSSEDS